MSGLSANHGKCDGPPTDTTYVSIGGPVLARGRPRIEAARDQPVGSAGCTQVSRLVGGVAVLLVPQRSAAGGRLAGCVRGIRGRAGGGSGLLRVRRLALGLVDRLVHHRPDLDRKSTRLNSSH